MVVWPADVILQVHLVRKIHLVCAHLHTDTTQRHRVSYCAALHAHIRSMTSASKPVKP
jgi:hypothetical protein